MDPKQLPKMSKFIPYATSVICKKNRRGGYPPLGSLTIVIP